QDVEQGFAQPVAGRPDRLTLRRDKRAAAQASADDAHQRLPRRGAIDCAACAVCSVPHETRPCPGFASLCASRAGPTCDGGGLGRGIAVILRALRHLTPTPTPNPSPQGGGEHIVPVARARITRAPAAARGAGRARGRDVARGLCASTPWSLCAAVRRS